MDVSVIITTYNRLWSLPKAIESCKHTKCRTEIIVVDDGSTDGTREWLKTQKDVISIYQTNQGQTYAINHGMQFAAGKYVKFLDSDDFLEEGILDIQFQKAEAEQAELVVSNVALIDYKTQKIIAAYNDPLNWPDFIEVQLSPRYGSHFLAMLFQKDWVLKVPRRPDYANREDRMFLLEYALLKPKIVYEPKIAGYWVKHDSQMQANYSGLKSVVTNWQHLSIYKKIAQKLEEEQEFTPGRRAAMAASLWPLAHWIAKTHLHEAEEVVDWIFRLDPNFQIAEKGVLGWMYRNLGFSYTEKILTIRRKFKYGLWS